MNMRFLLLTIMIFQLAAAEGGGVEADDCEGNCETFRYDTTDDLKERLGNDLKNAIHNKLLKNMPGIFSSSKDVTIEVLRRDVKCEDHHVDETATASQQEQEREKTRIRQEQAAKTISKEICDDDGGFNCEDAFVHFECIYQQSGNCSSNNMTIARIAAEKCQLMPSCTLSPANFSFVCTGNTTHVLRYSCRKKDWFKRNLGRQGWYRLNGTFYKLLEEKVVYEAAKKSCRAQGGKLASSRMLANATRRGLESKVLSNHTKIWIGLEKQRDEWIWSDGSKQETTGSDWGRGEPNNICHDEGENCAVYNKFTHAWRLIDVVCTQKHVPLCEITL